MSKPSLYRNDHIFGRVDVDLNVGLFEHWGSVFAEMLPSGARFLVASDHRGSSEAYKAALLRGLRTRKILVLDAGRLPTDLLSFGNWIYKADGYASVTGGSHSPAWNGLRWSLTNTTFPLEEQVARLKASSSDFIPRERPQEGLLQACDIVSAWVPWLQSVWYDTPIKPLRVIVDPMYGNWARLARESMQAVFPHVLFEPFRDEPSEDFHGIVPRSRYPKTLRALCDEVVKTRADLGIALDADAGHFLIVDSNGVPLQTEEIAWFFLHDLLGVALEGEIFLHDVYCSELILAEGRRLGGIPVLSKMGERAFSQRMKDTDALIGLGSDGEIYFRGAQGQRIVVFTLCWLIDYMLCNDLSLSEWRKRCPFFFTTSEFRTPAVPIELIASRFSEKWRKTPRQTIEGIRFDTAIGRVDIRSIPDYGQLGFRFDATSRSEEIRFVRESIKALEGLDEVAPFLELQFATELERRFVNDSGER